MPEITAEYIAEEFNLKTDELFLMYLGHREKLAKISERRKTPVDYRLKYGVKILFGEIKFEKENATKSFLRGSLSQELNGYRYFSKNTREIVSVNSILNLIDKTYHPKIDIFTELFVEEILNNFDVYNLYSLNQKNILRKSIFSWTLESNQR